MTAILTPTPTSTSTSASAVRHSGQNRPLWGTGLAAGVVAALATVAVAAIAQALGVSLETGPGETIPLVAFGQLTLFFTVIGVMIARTIGRRAGQPRTVFIRTTMILTALSLVPDVILSADLATKATLVLTHLVAAAIVVPAVSSCLSERGVGEATRPDLPPMSTGKDNNPVARGGGVERSCGEQAPVR